MQMSLLETIGQTYALHLSLLTFVLVAAITALGAKLVRMAPRLREADDLNRDTARQK